MKIANLILIGMIVLAATPIFADQDCPIEPSSCAYYLCREEKQRCGYGGYFIGFGYRYCDAFLFRTKEKVSEQGKQWLESVAMCLQRKLSLSAASSCEAVKAEAIDGHTGCYEETGFCDLPVDDMVLVANTVKAELKDLSILNQMRDVAKACKARLGDRINIIPLNKLWDLL